MNPLARLGNRRSDRHLRSELQRVGDALDMQFADALPQLDPSVLRTRLEPIMEDLSTSEENNERLAFDAVPTTPKRSRAAGGMALALVAGVVGTSAAFLTFGNDGTKSVTSNVAQVATTQTELQYLNASYIPKDFCLFYANVQEPGDDQDMYSPEQFLLKGDKGGAVSITVMSAMMGGMPPSLTGENVDINGNQGSLTGKAPNTSLSWKRGKTSVTMAAKDVAKEPLLAMARSIVLRFDENGAQIGSITAPGFTQQAAPDPASRAGGYANWGKCGASYGPEEFPNLSLSVGRPNPLGEDFMFGPTDADMEESEYPIQRDGKTIKAKKVIMDFQGHKNTSVSWTEKDTAVSLNITKLDDTELAKIVDGLVPISKADFKKLSKTAKPPMGMGSEANSFPADGPNKMQDLDTFTEGTTEVSVQAGIKDGKLCPTINAGSGSSGPSCLGVSAKPKFMMNMSSNTYSLSLATTDETVVKAQMVFADGTTKDIRSMVDPRLPKVRLFVLYRKIADPTPAKIQFLDASGKVVSEQ
jgi:hypothetical protein